MVDYQNENNDVSLVMWHILYQ